MASAPKKQYGLILKKENAPLSSSGKIAVAFADDDEDVVDTQIMSSQNTSASTMRVRMQAKRIYERAIAEDPSVFQYDEIYEDIQSVKEAKQAEQKKADKERKPKYISSILEAHKRRQVEHQLRDERKQEKERQAEGEMYKDKEVFVTGAYRKQMEEAQELRKELILQDRLDELTAVEKQKLWQAGFHRTMLHDIARDIEAVPSTSKVESIKVETAVSGDSCSPDHGEKLRELRRKIISSEVEQLVSESRPIKMELKEEKDKSYNKRVSEKSIYSDDSENEIPKEEVKVELKPGLNVLSKDKKLTKAEQLRSRFTPSDSESDEKESEGSEKRYRNYEDRDHGTSQKPVHHNEKKPKHRSRSRGESGRKRASDEKFLGKRERSRDRKRRHSRYERRSRSHSTHCDYNKGSRSQAKNSDERHLKKENDQPLRRYKEHNRGKRSKESKSRLITKLKLTKERIEGFKQILKQRNGSEEIAGFRDRYLERRVSGSIALPF